MIASEKAELKADMLSSIAGFLRQEFEGVIDTAGNRCQIRYEERDKTITVVIRQPDAGPAVFTIQIKETR